MTSEELANMAIKNLNGKTDRKHVQMAVLNACLEFPDLVPQQTIDEATARILRGISVAEQMTWFNRKLA